MSLLLRRTLICLPLLAFALKAFFLVRWGVDMPFWDDWRQYAGDELGSLKLSYLFTPINDTLFPVGQLLDSLAFRLFGAHAVAYQLLSLVAVMGSILWLIWQLLQQMALPPLVRAVAFCFTLPMLQPDSYWGLQNLAYHQALPLIAVLAVVYLAQRPVVTWSSYVAVGLLGLFAGLSYISGAFAMVALSVVLFCYGGGSRRLAWALALPALLCTLAQLWVIFFYQQGLHVDDYPMAFPWQLDFWMFALGNVGRSLLLSGQVVNASLSLTLSAVVLVVWGGLLWRQPGLPLRALSAVALLYLAMVAVGRTHFHPDSFVTPLEIYSFGFIRFHFFWLTLVWPFLVATLWQQVVALKPQASARVFVLLAALIPAAWLFYTPVLQHSPHYQAAFGLRTQGIICLQEQIAAGASRLACPTLHMLDAPHLLPDDLTPAIENARAKGASFIHQISPKSAD